MPLITSANIAFGGEMYYECLGSGNSNNTNKYKLSMDYYVECGSFLDQDSFTITLYKGLDENYTNPYVYLDSTILIGSPDYPCLNIPSELIKINCAKID